MLIIAKKIHPVRLLAGAVILTVAGGFTAASLFLTQEADSIQTTYGVDWVDVIATLLANASETHPVSIGDWEGYGSGAQFTLVKSASPKHYVRFYPASKDVTLAAAPYGHVDAYIVFYNATTQKWYAIAAGANGIVEIQNPS